MAKKVTPRKLVAASRALLALQECDDYDDIVRAAEAAHYEAFERDEDSRPQEQDYPSSGQLVTIAQLFSRLAVPDGADALPLDYTTVTH